jgi:hypothetical protein
MPDVSVVAVSWNTADQLPAALDTVAAACGDRRHEIIVVDNASSDDSVAVLEARDDCRVIALPENAGFTSGANLGAFEATGDYVLFLNPDVAAPPGSIAALVDALATDPRAWGATPWFRNPDGSPQYFWIRFPGLPSLALAFTRWGRRVDAALGSRCRQRRNYRDLPDPPGTVAVDAAGAAFLLVRRQEFVEAGGFDEVFFNFFQDGEFARRMSRAGRYLLGVGGVDVTHGMAGAVRKLPSWEAEAQFLFGYRQYLAGEPRLRRLVGDLSVRLDVGLPRPQRREMRRRVLQPVSRRYQPS